MTTYVGLLRGINVGGNNKIPMDELRVMCTALGLGRVRTYIQSGNIIFESGLAEDEVATLLEQTIAATFGFAIPVVVRTAEELRAVVSCNPFAGEAQADGTKVFVQFFSSPLADGLAAKLDPAVSPTESFRLIGRDLFLHLPGGAGTSELMVHVAKKLGKLGTARNWNTVLKLADLTAAGLAL